MPDYIVVGQGLCGTFLSYFLSQTGKDVLVIDKPQPGTASKVASGIINPVTGRRIVKTWLIDEVLPFAVSAYQKIGKKLGANFIQQTNILDFFATRQMEDAFTDRMAEEPDLLHLRSNETEWQTYFRYIYCLGEIDPCYLTDVQKLLTQYRAFLKSKNALWEEEFEWDECKIEAQQVTYKNISAEKIFFCGGTADASNPYFNKLPFAFNKGEALIVKIDGLPRTNIYKQGINIVPWKEENLFWIGSNYLWDYTDLQPTDMFRKKTEEQLRYWLKLPFKVIDHIASERPANVERRPFAGLHPQMPSVGILNGMGTKGCSLAPFFAHQLAEHVVNHTALEPLADIKRFTRILSR